MAIRKLFNLFEPKLPPLRNEDKNPSFTGRARLEIKGENMCKYLVPNG